MAFSLEIFGAQFITAAVLAPTGNTWTEWDNPLLSTRPASVIVPVNSPASVVSIASHAARHSNMEHMTSAFINASVRFLFRPGPCCFYSLTICRLAFHLIDPRAQYVRTLRCDGGCLIKTGRFDHGIAGERVFTKR